MSPSMAIGKKKKKKLAKKKWKSIIENPGAHI
jgi:hypothetical protein